ncbi:transposase [Prevotella histicola]|uniref:transposase n=1 Tax=Prevotella histicola TaxID=470565 RepID=UPI0028EEA7DE|nr:transposase [Prevotella histicola]
MITKDKVTEIFCIIDEFDKNLDGELKRNLRLPIHNGNGKRYRNRKGRLSESEVMTILICYHFGTYRNFKEYYQNCIRGCFHKEFPHAVSYNRFVELMPRVLLSIQLVHGLKAKMKNKLIPMWDKIMLRKRYIIECINELLKDKANLVHSRHRSIRMICHH